MINFHHQLLIAENKRELCGSCYYFYSSIISISKNSLINRLFNKLFKKINYVIIHKVIFKSFIEINYKYIIL